MARVSGFKRLGDFSRDFGNHVIKVDFGRIAGIIR